MRRFIHNPQTKTFFAEDGTWTTDIDRAREFVSDDEVRKTRDAFNLMDCELDYCVAKNLSGLDFAIPLKRLR